MVNGLTYDGLCGSEPSGCCGGLLDPSKSLRTFQQFGLYLTQNPVAAFSVPDQLATVRFSPSHRGICFSFRACRSRRLYAAIPAAACLARVPAGAPFARAGRAGRLASTSCGAGTRGGCHPVCCRPVALTSIARAGCGAPPRRRRPCRLLLAPPPPRVPAPTPAPAAGGRGWVFLPPVRGGASRHRIRLGDEHQRPGASAKRKAPEPGCRRGWRPAGPLRGKQARARGGVSETKQRGDTATSSWIWISRSTPSGGAPLASGIRRRGSGDSPARLRKEAAGAAGGV